MSKNHISFTKYTSYTNAGSYASKLHILDTWTKDEQIILIVKDSTEVQKYLQLGKNIGIHISQIQSFDDIHDSIKDSTQLKVISQDILVYEIETSLFLDILDIKVGQQISPETCIEKLVDYGYEFSEYKQEAAYKKTGDTLWIYKANGTSIGISFWGDEVESIICNTSQIQNIRFGSIKAIEDTPKDIREKRKEYILVGDILGKNIVNSILDNLAYEENYEYFVSLLQASSFDTLPQTSQGRSHINLPVEGIQLENIETFKSYLSDNSLNIHIYTKHYETITNFLKHNNLDISLIQVKTNLLQSFCYSGGKKTVFICDDIISKIFIKKRSKKQISADMDLLLKIKSGDYIVHIDHGVGLFTGIIKKSLGDITKEYLEIHYKDEERLFVPITEIHRVSKYVGVDNPSLTPLSGKVWEKKIAKVREDIREIAEEILKNFAERKLRAGSPNSIDDADIKKFWESFPYSYTPDQETAIEEIFSDMSSEKNMDRLVVGDVGFGKTEVALNAAYLTIKNKKQVLFISPLVVLAHEHYNSCKERLGAFGIHVGVLTRLQSQKEATLALKKFAEGEIDILVGTHRLLGDKLRHKNLGLLIVDEEHKFGVVDKERIKNLKSDIDILSLSATPIPRSLNLALSGVRDISLLKTPPSGRKSIETSVTEYSEAIIEEAGKREFSRGGQIFFVHNRLSNIEVIQKQLQNLFPDRRIIITHGQLPGDELEDKILAFKEKKYDILLSTTVIENGIDFSNVNTIFINECQKFGISQIHQLRGRVGRSSEQGYCYLLYRRDYMNDEAAKRIKTIVDYSYLGAGFELAMKDLEIRGGGDILGIKQSGQSKEIGVSLFLKMLEEKISELKEERETKKEAKPKNIKTLIDIQVTASIPDTYFLNESDKIHFYRELELVENLEDLTIIYNSFFQNTQTEEIPASANTLFLILKLQLLGGQYDIARIRKQGGYYVLEYREETSLDTIKKLLMQDIETKIQVVSATKLRLHAKEFANEVLFLQYLEQLLLGSLGKSKYKIIQKVA